MVLEDFFFLQYNKHLFIVLQEINYYLAASLGMGARDDNLLSGIPGIFCHRPNHFQSTIIDH